MNDACFLCSLNRVVAILNAKLRNRRSGSRQKRCTTYIAFNIRQFQDDSLKAVI
jgi:hypothetical protein